ncbi:RNI-like protein [Gloeophyllum trabeum ATCC 11539]|uniref:RNI-like protein n=1 Tax=Gloeophyllum trabeum (strain ATCC 11539 / FP-39264 / Madison 617) TaxID=670483 RepID=S7R8L8_GLOTA|nr:RNI-like protein [Gloeophyllum trabeum ATCC 11539]EPQ50665.1 RNI-like protein [Gloeophyllum trabeum ATCC 11539]
MRSNNVRGPTSALTEFLRESGITATTIARRVRTQDRTEEQPEAGPSNVDQTNEEAQDGSQDEVAEEYHSDNLDEPDEPSPKKRKVVDKGKGKAKAAAKKSKKDDDDASYDEEEDAYTAISKQLWKGSGSGGAKPPVGSFENCAKCEKQFTVTKYTMAARPGPGWLCHQCAKASGADPFKKPAVPRKRKAVAEKRNVVSFEERTLPSLASLCIKIISNHIDDVEALGDIGTMNLDEIAKSISRNRSMTADNVQLFYDIQNVKLTLYDVTNLTSSAFSSLAMLNPNLTSLRLDYCGRMDDHSIAAFNQSLPSLKRIDLLGPFLVRVDAWKSFFEAHPDLEGFLITQSPRFDLSCMQSLVENCKGLKELRLKEVGKMDDTFLQEIVKWKGTLKRLDLSDPGSSKSVTDDACIEMMQAIGPQLEHLDLSGHEYLTDEFLRLGLTPNAGSLSSLSLANLPDITDAGVASVFDTWMGIKAEKPSEEADMEEVTGTNPPLTSINMSRNSELSAAALMPIVKHSGKTLQNLNINGWKTVSQEALTELAKRVRDLKTLDVGWCREVNDFVIKDFLDKCEKISDIQVWGCNKLTESCPRKKRVTIRGIETDSVKN